MAGLRGATASRGSGGVPGPLPNSAPLCTERTRGPLQVGERSGGGGESRERPGPRAARSACTPHSVLDSGSGARGRAGCFGRQAKLIVPQVRGSRSVRRQGSKSGRRSSRGRRRRAKARLVVGVSVFFLKTPLGHAEGALRPPPPFPPQARRGRPGGGGRRRGPASGAFPATCQFYCCRACESLHSSPYRRSARWTPKRPSPTPRHPRPDRTPRAELRAAAWSRGRRREKGPAP